MIKRSVPVTLSVFAQTADYAEGVKDGIMYTLERSEEHTSEL